MSPTNAARRAATGRRRLPLRDTLSESSMPVPAFVEVLELCITELSAIVSHTSTIWADHCESPGDKTQFQAPLACEKGLAH